MEKIPSFVCNKREALGLTSCHPFVVGIPILPPQFLFIRLSPFEVQIQVYQSLSPWRFEAADDYIKTPSPELPSAGDYNLLCPWNQNQPKNQGVKRKNKEQYSLEIYKYDFTDDE